ncbi:MAG TPA: hypothetical protein ENH89_07825, partial [Aurantimonas coralicida]|nr:hypothetical protein [Aurantimonas coralicida]
MTLPIRASEATLIEVRQALQRVELNRRTAPQHNFTATTDPGVTDDESEGYTVQSWWFNDTSDELFLCTDATTGAAVWQNLTAAEIIGGASKAFKTITAPDANSVVADNASDTLTITESGGIAITVAGTAENDTLNFDGAASSHNHSAADITSGLLALARGGTAADLNATGGASQVLQQASAGAAITVGQLASSDLSDTANIMLADGTVPFVATVVGVEPTVSNHLVTKEYVDRAINFIEEFFFNNVASDIGGIYFEMLDTSTGAGESTFTAADLGGGDGQALTNWATLAGVPGVITMAEGVYTGHLHAERTVGNRSVNLYFEIWTRLADSPFTETLRITSETSSEITSKTEVELHGV